MREIVEQMTIFILCFMKYHELWVVEEIMGDSMLQKLRIQLLELVGNKDEKQ
jgi:hypothetical protein